MKRVSTVKKVSKRATKRRSRIGSTARQRDNAVLERSAAKMMRGIIQAMSRRRSQKRSLSGRGTRKKRRRRRKR